MGRHPKSCTSRDSLIAGAVRQVCIHNRTNLRSVDEPKRRMRASARRGHATTSAEGAAITHIPQATDRLLLTRPSKLREGHVCELVARRGARNGSPDSAPRVACVY